MGKTQRTIARGDAIQPLTRRAGRVRVHRFRAGESDSELYDRFLALREQIYGDDYFFYSDADLHRQLIDYYACRPDYRFEMLLCEQRDGEDIGRVLVGRAGDLPWTFFGFFECPHDSATFSVLMDAALESAYRLGGDTIFGPLDFNSLHAWMFQLDSEPRERWVGDLYHRSYYPELFQHAGWRITHESVSGEIRPDRQAQLMKRFGSLPDQLRRQGFEFIRRGDLPDDELVRLIWKLVEESFTPDLHRYVSVDYDFFRAIFRPFLARLSDPFSACGFLKDGKLAAYTASFVNYIEDLCNADGSKVRPTNVVPEPRRFSSYAAAVAKDHRGSELFPGLLVIGAQHSQRRYGHCLTWRRTSVANPGTAKVRAISTITSRHVTFGRPLVQLPSS